MNGARCSIAAKRCLLPSKQGDDGWTSICYDGSQIGSLKGKCLEIERAKEKNKLSQEAKKAPEEGGAAQAAEAASQ